MKNGINKDKGITLITLVVTIVVLLILTSIATYSGINAARTAEFTRFDTELKIMQTQVNSLYDKWKNGETINEQEVLSIGEDILSNEQIKKQADIVFTQNASGIDGYIGYKYYSLETIEGLGIEGVTQEFFVNIQTRSVVSCYGLEFKGKTYYTLSQMSDGLYNVEYNNQNTTISPELEDVKVETLDDSSWKLTVQNITYGGYVQKGKIQYQRLGNDYWSETTEDNFTVMEQGVYLIKVLDSAGNESDSIVKYVGNIKIAGLNKNKVIIPGIEDALDKLTVEYKEKSAKNWENDLTNNYFTVVQSGMYNIKFTTTSNESDTILIYAGDINFSSANSTSWNFTIDQSNYKIKYKDDERLSIWQLSNNNIVTINTPGIYNFKVVDDEENESYNSLEQYAYVKDGLILYYDGINNTGEGNNPSATTWKDLSGNNNDGIMTNMNSETGYYSEDESGYVFFENGSYITSQNNIGITGDANFTVESVAKPYADGKNANYSPYASTYFCWFGTTKVNIGKAILFTYNRNTNTIGGSFINHNISSNASYDLIEKRSYVSFRKIKTGEISPGVENIGKLNLNGKEIPSSYTGTATFTTDIEDSPIQVGRGWQYNNQNRTAYEALNVMRVYNRPLTDEEIKINYAIDKIRYNISE